MLAAYTPYHNNNVFLHFSALEVKGAESTRHSYIFYIYATRDSN